MDRTLNTNASVLPQDLELLKLDTRNGYIFACERHAGSTQAKMYVVRITDAYDGFIAHTAETRSHLLARLVYRRALRQWR